MELLWFASIRSITESVRKKSLIVSLLTTVVLTGCLDAASSKPTTSTSSASATGSASSSTSTAAYTSAGSVKVIFNKQSFYNNYETNSFSCAGDAKNFYDPFTDRQIPSKPAWLKNIAVEITNSNALQGPSNAVGCALSGLNASLSANCASFDDTQANAGDSSKFIAIGGRGCVTGDNTCTNGSANGFLGDIWVASTSDVSSNAVWSNQSGAVPGIDSTTRGGLLWAAGDFDELHNEFYAFGGLDLNTGVTDPFATPVFSAQFRKFTLNSDGSLSTNPAPVNFALTKNLTFNWDFSENYWNPFPTAAASVGATMTYSIRRDPTLKSNCTEGSVACGSSSLNGITGGGTRVNAIAKNEHSDYFLLVGGLDAFGNMFSNIWAFKPHGYSNDVGTAPDQPNANGDVDRLSNNLVFSSKGNMSVDISTSSSSTTPFTITARTFTGRGFHRTVFDPKMNRYYIFGGLQNHAGSSVFITGVNPVIPDIATSEVWMYDPPALGRKPTSTCWTDQDPNGDTLLTIGVNTSDVLGSKTNLNINRNYLANKTIFPPGGCLQRVKLPNSASPKARFEHAMAFDREQEAMFVFGGCTQAALIAAPGFANAGSPLGNCTQNALLNDMWMYVPPKSVEIVPSTYSATTGPFSAANLFSNVFGTDYWLDHTPLYVGNNITSGVKTAPTTAEVMGKWIQLTPTGVLPTVRASAGFIYDHAHHNFFLQGGYGCSDTTCPQALNDTWVYTPPKIATDCDIEAGICNNQGSWTQIRSTVPASANDQPTLRYGFLMAPSNPSFSHGDNFYTVTDSSCDGQGPIASNDASVSKKNVGAIYIDLDRTQMGSSENILLNLRFLPFDQNTKLAGIFDNGTPLVTSDDADHGSVNDQAVIRIQLLSNFIQVAEQIQSLVQPRYHEFSTGTPVYGDTFAYIAGASGQVTEKQVLIPLNINPSINLIKIERVQGSAKFFELTVSKY